MHLQLTKVRSGKSTKRYARLVQSYRRGEGMPVQKILANLGELSDREISNFRLALEASRKSKTVEGLRNRHKISILLLCNEHGYPIRWSTLPGRTRDGHALQDLVGNIERRDWAHGVPIVFDRAMGAAGAVARLCKSELRFLTAVRRSEIRGYTNKLPDRALTDLGGSEEEAEHRRLSLEAARRVEASGMQKVDESLYVLDLGVTTRGLKLLEASPICEQDIDIEKLEGGARWLLHARRYRALLDDKTFATQADIARQQGVSRARMTQIMNLLRLDESLQKEVLAGNYGYISDRSLRTIATLRSKATQKRALLEHAGSTRPVDPSRKPRFEQRSTLDASQGSSCTSILKCSWTCARWVRAPR